MAIFNRKAKFNYSLEGDRIEAGIHLLGVEVVAIREGKAQMVDAYVDLVDGEAWIKNFHVMCKEGAFTEIDPLRPRKLLLHKKEIQKLQKEVIQKGFTLIPISIYPNERGKYKVQLSLAKGKTNWDKRQDLKDKAMKRDSE